MFNILFAAIFGTCVPELYRDKNRHGRFIIHILRPILKSSAVSQIWRTALVGCIVEVTLVDHSPSVPSHTQAVVRPSTPKSPHHRWKGWFGLATVKKRGSSFFTRFTLVSLKNTPWANDLKAVKNRTLAQYTFPSSVPEGLTTRACPRDRSLCRPRWVTCKIDIIVT